MQLSNVYASLPEIFFEKVSPLPVRDPQLFLWNSELGEELMVSEDLRSDETKLAQIFSGNEPLPESNPIATAYAGHQFGHFVPQLGDGRAHLLGELTDRFGKKKEIQLKGSGQTPFSRGGDGRCALGPAIREFIMSEAMSALGVSTTRSLAVVTTGEEVQREVPLPGAVVTRVASSHLRVGTFEFFAARQNHDAIEALADFAIDRHYPELKDSQDRYTRLFESVLGRQIDLVVSWMRVGFIHGVMNTDNTAISGETIDYGPCAMMSSYSPRTVFSSIDRNGRYAFGNQPMVAGWNMARFAETLIPLVDEDEGRAIEELGELVNAFSDRFADAWLKTLGGKLGFASIEKGDNEIVSNLMQLLETHALDYTTFFYRLGRSLTNESVEIELKRQLPDWYERWRARTMEQSTVEEAQSRMEKQNPVVIPRNHHMEAVLRESIETGEGSAADTFLEVLRSPYEEGPKTHRYQDPPADGDRSYKTFCGT